MGKYAPVFDLVFGVLLTLIGMAGLRWLRSQKCWRQAACVALVLAAAGTFAFLVWTRVQEIEQETARHRRLAELRTEVRQWLDLGETLQREILLFRPQSFKLAEFKVECWRTAVIDRLSDELPKSSAKDRFQQVSLVYPHRNRLEWVQLWLAELRNQLWQVYEQLETFLAESAQNTGSIPNSKID